MMSLSRFPRSVHPIQRTGAVLCAVSVALTLGGCAVGPDYQRPDMAVPSQYKETPSGWKEATPADTESRGPWWTVFGDPRLDTLMHELTNANQSLAVAQANWRQATALAQNAHASLFPTLGASTSASRADSSSSSSTSRGVTNSLQAGLSASWEVDLWGRLRRTAEAQDANAQASLADLANTQLSLTATLASDYFLLRVADAQQDLYAAIIQAYADSLQLTRNRFAAGVATRSEVAQAQTQWLSARASAESVRISRAQLEHAIAILVGKAPANFSLPPDITTPPGQLTQAAPAVPVTLPSTLLERRPDVAAAERSAAAANAQIGVARAALFPSLTLSASGGYSGSTLGQLFDASQRFWTLGPAAMALTLFDAGARQASIRQAEAAYDASAATYRQNVLTALQEVEDQLAALRILANQAQLQDQAVSAAATTLSLVTNQYKAGTVSYLDVITAQTADQNARLSALSVRSQQLSATVSLIKALGGGWEGLPPPASSTRPVSAAQ